MKARKNSVLSRRNRAVEEMGNTHVPLMSSLLVGRGGADLATASAMLDGVAALIRCLVARGRRTLVSSAVINTIVTGRDAVRWRW